MPLLVGGQVLEREGGQVMPSEGGALLEGGQLNLGEHGLIEGAEEPTVGIGPYSYSGVPPDGYKNGIAEKGAYLVDILAGDTYRNTGTKAATVWTEDAASGGGSGVLAVDFSLTDAEVRALIATPKATLPAQAANTLVVPVLMVLTRKAGLAYANTDNWGLNLSYHSAPNSYTLNDAGITAAAAGLTGTTDSTLIATPVLNSAVDYSPVYGDGVDLTASNPAGELTGGSGGLFGTLIYRAVPVA